MRRLLAGLPLLLASAAAHAAGPIEAGTRQGTNWVAIGMFAGFVALTMGITYWAAGRTKTASDFYSAGGGITGFQNGVAIAGDYMSAASFLGISGTGVYSNGYRRADLLRSDSSSAGPSCMFTDRGTAAQPRASFTFADVAVLPPATQTSDPRAMSAMGTLIVTVSFYLIAQMVGAGQAHPVAVRPRLQLRRS